MDGLPSKRWQTFWRSVQKCVSEFLDNCQTKVYATLVIAESNDKSVQISADTSSIGDMLNGMTIKIGERSKELPWKSVKKPSFYPEILVENIDNDPDHEVVVILTTGEGTGIRQSEIHVVQQDFSEFTVMDPVQGIKERLKATHVKGEGKHIYTLTANNTTIKKEYDNSEAGQWFDDVVFGNIVRYGVRERKVVAEVPAQVSPGIFMANVEIEYQVDGQELKINSISLLEME